MTNEASIPHLLLALFCLLRWGGDTALATTPDAYPYAAHFEQAELVIVAYCAGIVTVSKEKSKNGTSISTLRGTFQKRATFKGSSKQEFIELDHNEVEITDATIAKKLRPETLEALVGAISEQPVFEMGKTYLIFLGAKGFISAIEVPDKS